MARHDYYPTLDVGGSFYRKGTEADLSDNSDMRHPYGWQVHAILRWTIWSGNRRSQQVALAERIKAEGFDAVAALIKPEGPYVWKNDGYVFCLDSKEGKFLAHPFLPQQMMNRPMLHMTDTNGKAFIKEMLEIANKEGKGWVTYMSRRRGFRETQLKKAYLLKVPDTKVLVGAGYFPKQK